MPHTFLLALLTSVFATAFHTHFRSGSDIRFMRVTSISLL